MHYPNIRPAEFLRRENRFTAALRLPTGEEIAAHVRTTGRCAELFRPACPPGSVCPVAVPQDRLHPHHGGEGPGLSGQCGFAGPEPPVCRGGHRRGHHPAGDRPGAVSPPGGGRRPPRLDFLVTGAAGELWCELKGVTLERDGAALFPDAPTERGLKHLAELTDLAVRGWRTAAVFLIAMEPVTRFSPNTAAQPAFAQALREAKTAGVELLAYRCRVTPDSLSVLAPVPVLL